MAAWTRRVVAACTERLGYKAAALFLAVALWLAAHVEAGRFRTPGVEATLAQRLVELVTPDR